MVQRFLTLQRWRIRIASEWMPPIVDNFHRLANASKYIYFLHYPWPSCWMEYTSRLHDFGSVWLTLLWPVISRHDPKKSVNELASLNSWPASWEEHVLTNLLSKEDERHAGQIPACILDTSPANEARINQIAVDWQICRREVNTHGVCWIWTASLWHPPNSYIKSPMSNVMVFSVGPLGGN